MTGRVNRYETTLFHRNNCTLLHFFIGIIVFYSYLTSNNPSGYDPNSEYFMNRNITNQLVEWKNLKSKDRKSLLLQGARQTGKTYILKEFGKKHFKKTHYFDFMSNPELGKIFEKNFDTDRIVTELEFFINDKIMIEQDFIIFDEIQESSFALTALKYFTQNHPNSFICA